MRGYFVNLDQNQQAVETKQQSSPTDETTEEGSNQHVDQQPENKNQVTVLVILKLFINYCNKFYELSQEIFEQLS
jgi:hypothetical protein